MVTGPVRIAPGAGQIQPVGATQPSRAPTAPAGRQASNAPSGATRTTRN